MVMPTNAMPAVRIQLTSVLATKPGIDLSPKTIVFRVQPKILFGSVTRFSCKILEPLFEDAAWLTKTRMRDTDAFNVFRRKYRKNGGNSTSNNADEPTSKLD
jgi:hypothetical protein